MNTIIGANQKFTLAFLATNNEWEKTQKLIRQLGFKETKMEANPHAPSMTEFEIPVKNVHEAAFLLDALKRI